MESLLSRRSARDSPDRAGELHCVFASIADGSTEAAAAAAIPAKWAHPVYIDWIVYGSADGECVYSVVRECLGGVDGAVDCRSLWTLMVLLCLSPSRA